MGEIADSGQGRLYVVATPIGNLQDLSPRAVEILSNVDLLAAEDTRTTQKLLNHWGIRVPCISYHDHNERERAAQIVDRMVQGGQVALVSDAGTPTVSDPGYRVVSAAHERGIPVSPIPGPCALIAALSASGLPTDRFAFEGFPPPRGEARRGRLKVLSQEPRTLVFYESARRAPELLADLAREFGESRLAALARELTKRFETVKRGPLSALCEWAEHNPDAIRGEWVIAVAGDADSSADAVEARRLLELLVPEMSASRAARVAATWTGLPRRECYAIAQTL